MLGPLPSLTPCHSGGSAAVYPEQSRREESQGGIGFATCYLLLTPLFPLSLRAHPSLMVSACPEYNRGVSNHRKEARQSHALLPHLSFPFLSFPRKRESIPLPRPPVILEGAQRPKNLRAGSGLLLAPCYLLLASFFLGYFVPLVKGDKRRILFILLSVPLSFWREHNDHENPVLSSKWD